MVINSFTPAAGFFGRTPQGSGNVADANRNATAPSNTPEQLSKEPRSNNAEPSRRVEAPVQADETQSRTRRQAIGEDEIRQAQLVIYNRRDFEASQSFLQVQNQEELGSIIDTFA